VFNSQFGYAEDPQLDAWYKSEVVGQTDPKKLDATLRKVGQFIHDNYITIPVVQFPAVYAVSKQVGEWPEMKKSVWIDYAEYIKHPTPLNTFRLADRAP
jgi:ABC-type transport system substrate-binding protein